ncbi:MAG: hypothetical protein CVU44_08815 [Chloroflexi bacterium HGW-Chloroflexi-6]|nr:MAG: hypothetical protein CVU44_08815 [Chloroflexi bacterium HGW-Chloroflexi-6]
MRQAGHRIFFKSAARFITQRTGIPRDIDPNHRNTFVLLIFLKSNSINRKFTQPYMAVDTFQGLVW